MLLDFCAMDYLGGYPSADTPGLIAGNVSYLEQQFAWLVSQYL
jgi:hypothetical protein